MKRIGRYELVGHLGQGGMGTVVRARDPELGREVAIKVLESGSARQRKRFAREAEGLARLRHPNVVRVHDVGREGDRAFIVMELVDGEDLQRRIDRDGPLTPREAARIGRDIARALAQVHALGILHRDLKPSNVMLLSDGRPLLTDFGLAHLADDDMRLTRSGASLGTPGFWPPEQALGKRDQVGPASDVYGVGATLYALLSARPPFDHDTVQGLLRATCEDPPESLQPRVDRALDEVVLRCLAKAPGDRYPSAEALADDLDRYLSGELSAARRSGRFAALGVAGLVVVVGLAGAAVAVSRRPGPGSDAADADATTSGGVALLPPQVRTALQALAEDDTPARRAAAEAAVAAIPGRLDEKRRAALLRLGGDHGARLVVVRLYREGRLEEAIDAAQAASAAGGGAWVGRAYGALTAIRDAREALAGPLRINANMSRSNAPPLPPDGLLPSWVGLRRALAARAKLSPKLEGLGELARDELRATAAAAVSLLGGPARDHQGEREAFQAFEEALNHLRRDEPEVYDGLGPLEERHPNRVWRPQPGDPDLTAVDARLQRIVGPGAEVLRIGCLGMIARDGTRPMERRIAAAREAARLALRDPDRPQGMSIRLTRAWRPVTDPIVDRVWVALRERQPPPYDLARLAEEMKAIDLGGPRAFILLCLGRREEARAIPRYPRSLLALAIQLELDLLAGHPRQALKRMQGISAFDASALAPVRAHARKMLGEVPGRVKPVRGVAQWFPWHTAEALPRVLSGEWWWPGEGPLSGG